VDLLIHIQDRGSGLVSVNGLVPHGPGWPTAAGTWRPAWYRCRGILAV